MDTLNSILAATDFSTPSRHAADRAALLAHETGAQLTLLHVVAGGALGELRRWLGAGHATEQQLLADAGEQLHRLAEQLAGSRAIAPRTHLATGSVQDRVIAQGDDSAANLLVLGARGAGFMRRLAIGTTSDRLLGKTTRPLLVVRQTPHESYRRVLVAIDFSPWSPPAVALARQVAPRAHLVLMSAFEVPFEGKLRFAGVDEATIARYRQEARKTATRRLQALAQSGGLLGSDWEPCVVEGDASQRLVEQEQELDCELVVLGKHGQSAAEDFLLGSVTKHVLAEGQADVLVSTLASGQIGAATSI